MHIFKVCKDCVCVRRVFSCPWAALFGLKLSFRVTAGTFAPPSNFFHSHFSSFQLEGHSVSFFLLYFIPPFPILPFLLLIALVSSRINTSPSLFFTPVSLCSHLLHLTVSPTLIPSHCGRGQRKAFFSLLAAVSVSTFFSSLLSFVSSLQFKHVVDSKKPIAVKPYQRK